MFFGNFLHLLPEALPGASTKLFEKFFSKLFLSGDFYPLTLHGYFCFARPLCSSVGGAACMSLPRVSWASIWMAGTQSSFTPSKWAAHIGLSFAVLSVLWAKLPGTEVSRLGIEPVHLLWLVTWLRLYEAWEVAATRWHCCEKTYRVRVKQILELLYMNLDEIHMGDRGGNAFSDRVFLVLDATACPVQ